MACFGKPRFGLSHSLPVVRRTNRGNVCSRMEVSKRSMREPSFRIWQILLQKSAHGRGCGVGRRASHGCVRPKEGGFDALALGASARCVTVLNLAAYKRAVPHG